MAECIRYIFLMIEHENANSQPYIYAHPKFIQTTRIGQTLGCVANIVFYNSYFCIDTFLFWQKKTKKNEIASILQRRILFTSGSISSLWKICPTTDFITINGAFGVFRQFKIFFSLNVIHPTQYVQWDKMSNFFNSRRIKGRKMKHFSSLFMKMRK